MLEHCDISLLLLCPIYRQTFTFHTMSSKSCVSIGRLGVLLFLFLLFGILEIRNSWAIVDTLIEKN